ncbi:MAG TPA: glycoside hydrolase family 20 zincin-like fold domain-containing protein [Bryobacteraceae bacterium]
MNRRDFLQQAAAAIACSPLLRAASDSREIDLQNCTVVLPEKATAREKKAANALVEEVEKRSELRWRIQSGAPSASSSGIHLGTSASHLRAEGYTIHANGRSISIQGADERGLLFGIGKFLRLADLAKQHASITANLSISTSPKYPLRGHQLGYRPKTNAYDAWNVADWEQYIRDLAMFGTNAIELMPPHTDDLPNSPHFPLPPEQMMVQMSRIADSYGLSVWIWYPAMAKNYTDPATVASELQSWAHIYQALPRIDAIFVPGGDPGHTAPKPLLAFLEKQKTSLRRYHPKAEIWMSPQGFDKQWMDEFFQIVDQPHTQTWLDGVAFGPQSRLSISETRQRLPKHYPIRLYPDITHSVECQFPVPDWDVAYALTEGRECINPRPEGEATILRRYLPDTIGFITYSEGCNDDVNKFVWSSLGWDPDLHIGDALREYGHYFLGQQYVDSMAQGLLALEKNWRGPLATNSGVPVTLARFQDMEQHATPELLENWRFQQALYRAYYDASVHSRLIEETACVQRARDLLDRVHQIGWTPEPLGIGAPPSSHPPNGHDPAILLEQAEHILASAELHAGADVLRSRVRELAETLLQSIKMQLAVDRYQGEAVNRGANLETLDYPVTDAPWLRKQISKIRQLPNPDDQVKAIKQLLARQDPGPGGFYDELGNPSNRPHLILGPGFWEDPEFRHSVLTGFSYPDRLGSDAPIAWKRWGGSMFDAPLRMHYTGLDPNAQYRIRVVNSGDERRMRIRLVASGKHEIHPLQLRPWPPAPQEFDIPSEATSGGELDLAWTREQGLGGNGRGCQVAEVWLIRK